MILWYQIEFFKNQIISLALYINKYVLIIIYIKNIIYTLYIKFGYLLNSDVL